MIRTIGQKVITYPGIGDVTYRKKTSVRKIGIRISARTGISVSLPYNCPFSIAENFFLSKLDKVKDILNRFRRQNESLSGITIISPQTQKEAEQIRNEAKRILIPKIEKAAMEHGFIYRKVFIKNNVSNWGSCSSAKNINLNMKLIFLPDRLQQYVILHELCHLTHPNHGKEFHTLLDRLCCGKEKELHKELKSIILK